MTFDTISVIGLGYIGLPTAAMFASRQKKVIGVDVNPDVVDTINRGEIHIVEPGLEDMVKTAVSDGFLKAELSPQAADAFLISVPTPFDAENNPDLKYIEAAAKAIAPVLASGNLVILESTSPVGATESMAQWLAESRPDLSFPQSNGADSDIRIAHCPERVLPGKVIKEFVENDRVIGGMTSTCSEYAVELYKTFVIGECVTTNARTAEMAKLTENSCRDVQIAFANELSIICDQLDINVWELISLANRHPRINILQPGPGVGGHCIAVDPWFIVSRSPEESRLIRTAREVNDSKPEWVIQKVRLAVEQYVRENQGYLVSDVTIACYGLAFKADIDDLRESPSLSIAQNLANLYADKVIAVEPNIDSLASDSRIRLVTMEAALEQAHIHVMLVDHQQFKNLHIDSDYCIDTKGILNIAI